MQRRHPSSYARSGRTPGAARRGTSNRLRGGTLSPAPLQPGPLQRGWRRRLRSLAPLPEGWQRDDELGPFAGGGAHADGAAVRLHDALADGEPEPGALLLGGVEGHEDVLARILWNARAAVAEAHLDEIAPPRRVAPERHLVARQPGGDAQLASLRHRLHGVQAEVQEDLTELLRIARDARQLRRELDGQLHRGRQ